MTRAVIETNILVSALLKEHGAEAGVLFSIADKKMTWCVSPAILAEYETVLRRPKFARVNVGVTSSAAAAMVRSALGGRQQRSSTPASC